MVRLTIEGPRAEYGMAIIMVLRKNDKCYDIIII